MVLGGGPSEKAAGLELRKSNRSGRRVRVQGLMKWNHPANRLGGPDGRWGTAHSLVEEERMAQSRKHKSWRAGTVADDRGTPLSTRCNARGTQDKYPQSKPPAGITQG